MSNYQLPQGKVLVMRTCRADMSSYNGFVWPESGPVSAPDWEPTEQCGNGLHGCLWGEGDSHLLNWDGDAKWLIVEVDTESIIDLSGKVKFPSGNVVHCGDRVSATNFLMPFASGKRVIGGTATAGDYGTATAGYRGTATAGDGGTATAGDRGTATAGFGGTATAGDYGTATAGDYGTATAGDYGTATAGFGGTATAGYRGTATAGDYGTLLIRYHHRNSNSYRVAIGIVGENGIEANTPYRVEDGKLKRVEIEEAQ